METIGIIGNGRFGALLAKVLNKNENYSVRVFSRRETPDNQYFFSLNEVLSSDIIIPCVPISIFEHFFIQNGEKIKKSSLVVDIASIKVHTTEIIKKHSNADVLSTHPTFGPDSSKNGTTFKNLKLIYWNERISNPDRSNNFLNFWKNLGCILVEMTPNEHDKQAAYTHAFAFVIGNIGIDLKVRKNDVSTKGFEGILYNQLAVENDTGQLFQDMMNYNPYVPGMIEEFEKSFKKIKKILK